MKNKVGLLRPIVVAVSGCFGVAPVWANPTGPQVMQGAAEIQGLGTNQLRVTNTPGSIIHWQGFSVGAGQVTQFIQQSASSSVLNRVVGADISQIHGQLLSNGRVFLINPAGILIGAGAVVDTAGFVGSTLRMQDADFLAGKLKFQGDGSSGSIVNQGWIRAGQGGNIVLVAPQIQNSGVLQTDGGQLVLAAGQKLTIGSLEHESVQFEIQAPTDSVLNVGKLLADGGAVGVFAGTLKHAGDIRAAAIARDATGRIVLKAREDLTLAAGSTTRADGPAGGDVLIQSANGHTRIAGEVSALGHDGRGGNINALGSRVSLDGSASLDASGQSGGGQILVGGDYQGANPLVANARDTFIGSSASLRADAEQRGDGGRIIIWADRSTQYAGTLSARGGRAAGNGGFAEVSGKEHLVFAGKADLSAPNGRFGDLLLDPLDLYIDARGGTITSIVDEITDVPNNAVTVSPDALAAIPGNVTLRAGRYMRFASPLTLRGAGQSLTAQVDRWTPTDPLGSVPNRLDVAADIVTNGGSVLLRAPTIRSEGTPSITTSGGAITLDTSGLEGLGATISASGLQLNAGSGVVVARSPASSISLGAVTGGSFSALAQDGIFLGPVTTTGLIDLRAVQRTETDVDGTVNVFQSGPISITGATASGGGAILVDTPDSSFSAQGLDSGGGAITVNAGGSIRPQAVNSGGGAVVLRSGSSVNTSGQGVSALTGAVEVTGTDVRLGVVDTSAAVTLTATNGSVFATVNRSSGVRATAIGSSGGQITLNSTDNAPLIVNTARGEATGCFSFFGCPSSIVELSSSGTGGIRLGEVSAKARESSSGSITERVSVNAANGPITGLPSASVTAADVTLATGQGSGGGIFGAGGAPLNVTPARSLTLQPNGLFNVNIAGASPYQLDVQVGVAPTGGNYSGGSLTSSSGNVLLTVGAVSDSNVLLQNLQVTSGFDTRRYQGGSPLATNDPFIGFRVPNGSLTANSIAIPHGSADPGDPLSLTALIGASGNLVVNNYARAGSAPNRQTIFCSGSAGPFSCSPLAGSGSVELFNIDAAQDSVTVAARNDVTISGATLRTRGDVDVRSTAGNIRVGRIDTRTGSGTGTVTLNAAGTVGALTDNADFEVIAGGSINVTGQTIGISAFTRPLDLSVTGDAAITLTSQVTGGQIGFAGVPVVADTRSLTINAASDVTTTTAIQNQGARFNVSTGAVALQNLSVIANPRGVQPDPVGPSLGQVRTEVGSANEKVYSFEGLRSVELNFDPGVIPTTQFDGGLLSVSSNFGPINLGPTAGVRMHGTGALEVVASAGSLLNATGIDGRSITLGANTSGVFDRLGSALRVGAIGQNVPVETLTITAGTGGFRTGSITTTGPVISAPAGSVSMTSYGGGIVIGSNGNDAIGSAAARSSAVNLHAFGNSQTSSAGTVRAGNIFADTFNASTRSDGIGTGGDLNVDATSSITLSAVAGNIRTGTLDAPAVSLTVGSSATVATGAIGGVRAATNVDISGGGITVNGAITADAASPVSIALTGTSSSGASGVSVTGAITAGAASSLRFESTGSLTLGPSGNAVVVAGDGSAIDILYRSPNSTAPAPAAFRFETLTAGPTGRAFIEWPTGIQQQGTGSGISAGQVVLAGMIDRNGAEVRSTTPTAVVSRTGGDGVVDLTGTRNLWVDVNGASALDLNGSTLSSLYIGKGSSTDAFTLQNVSAAQTLNVTPGASGIGLEAVSSAANPLQLTVDQRSGGVALTGGGIVTQGSAVNIKAAGAFNGTAGGIRTGGAEGGGTVTVETSAGSITTGLIDTSPSVDNGTNTGGAIALTTTCAGCGISVTGDLRTGPVGGPEDGSISLRTTSVTGAASSILQSGGSRLVSDSSSSVLVSAANGNVGTAADPLLITSPRVGLSAAGAAGSGIGNVFANLTDTGVPAPPEGPRIALDLRGDNGFAVTSSAAFSELAVATRGSASGTMTLTAPNQSYAFSRTAVDFLGNASPGTFQINDASGTSPTASSTFNAIDGHLLIAGGSVVNGQALTLRTSDAAGDIKLQGTAANRLNLTNGEQNFASARDLLITGGATLTASGTQTYSFARDFIVQAQGGSTVISGTDQSFSSPTTTGVSTIALRGGAGDGESVLVSATGSQSLRTEQGNLGRNISLLGGAGSGASVIVRNTGFSSQTVEAGGNLALTGGAGQGASADIVSDNGTQLARADGVITLTGGTGVNASTRIENTGPANQQVGEGRCSFFSCQQFQTDQILLQGGTGLGSSARIQSAGAQQVYVSFGQLSLLGGSGNNADASIINSSASSQNVGETNRQISVLEVRGGTGSGALAQIRSAGSQVVRATNSTTVAAGAGAGADALVVAESSQTVRPAVLNVTGGTSSTTSAKAQISSQGTQLLENVTGMTLQGGAGTDSTASVTALGQQTLRFSSGAVRLLGGAGHRASASLTSAANQSLSWSGSLSLSGGSGVDSLALISAAQSQSFQSFSGLTMLGGTNTGAFARIFAGGFQSFSGGNGAVNLTAGGTSASPVANAGATIEGSGQSFFCGSNCAITLTGGAGLAGGVSDALFRNNADGQYIQGGSITLNGGSQHSTTGIINGAAASTQQVVTTNATTGDLSLISPLGSAASAPVIIQQLSRAGSSVEGVPTPDQTIQSARGVLLDARGGADSRIASAGTQMVNARFVDVLTSAGSTGSSVVSAGSNQWIRTTNGALGPASLRAAALGTGTAAVDAGARQLLEIDHVELTTSTATPPGSIVVGDIAAAGTSRIQAADQSFFGRLLSLVGGGTNSTAKVTASNTQYLSLLDGGVSVVGGSGVNATAALDPTVQTVVANGTIRVAGGAGTAANASVTATEQTLIATTGALEIGAVGAGGTSRVEAGGSQTIHAAGTVQLNGGSTAGASAQLLAAGSQSVSFGALSLLGGGAADAISRIYTPSSQTLTGGNISVIGGSGASASVATLGNQVVNGAAVTVAGGTGTGVVGRITTPGVQNLTFSSLNVTAGTAAGANAQVDSGAAQSLNGGNVTVSGNGAGAHASIETTSSQLVNSSGTIAVLGGSGTGSTGRIVSSQAQTLGFNALTVAGGSGGGSAAAVSTSAAQSLNGTSGDISVTAAGGNATVEGHSQMLSCGTACDIVMQGASGAAGANREAVFRNLSGSQSISAGTIVINGGAQFSITGILNPASAGTQTISASSATPGDAFGIALVSAPAATATASVLIENAAATVQTLNAPAGVVRLDGQGDGNVVVSSAGTQAIDARALDVLTRSGGAANASVLSAGDQNVHTRGFLPGSAITGRVGSGSTGVARLESTTGNQTLNFGAPGLTAPGATPPELVVGRTPAGNAVGDSLIMAGNNQTIRTGALLIQGPSGASRISKVSTPNAQVVEALNGGISIIGGSGANSLATIDPTNQQITAFGPILLQGGSGPNADSTIVATGPQSVISQNGPITLIGGTAPGADALIVTTSPFQTVQGQGGTGPVLTQGGLGGGIAGLVQGSNTNALNNASNNATSEILREEEQLERTLEETTIEEEERRFRGRVQQCS